MTSMWRQTSVSSPMNCSARQGRRQERLNGFPGGQVQGANKGISMKELWRGSIEGLKTRWPSGMVTQGLAALAVGLTSIFRWDARQQDVNAHMPEFITSVLLAGILCVIGVFCLEIFALSTSSLLRIVASAVLLRVA